MPRSAVLLAGLGAAIALGCGPSFQAVYEGDVRFEHCYALDQGPAPADSKKECWREWLHGYTYGQSRDRVEYAATRYSELSLDPTLPKEDRELPRHAHAMAAPAPTNAFAPPPNVAERAGAEGTIAAGPTPPPRSPAGLATARAPGQACAEGCSGYWKACRQGCKGAACEACDRAYGLCVPACFQAPRR